MRQIVLDTETTGPERASSATASSRSAASSSSTGASPSAPSTPTSIPSARVELGATRVHGLTREDLLDKPKFRRGRGGVPRLHPRRRAHHPQRRFRRRVPQPGARPRGLRPLAGARRARSPTRCSRPGSCTRASKNSLDALCERYFVDNSHRTLHGALLDARLLGRVLPRDDARPGEPGDGARSAGGRGGRGRGGLHRSTSPSSMRAARVARGARRRTSSTSTRWRRTPKGQPLWRRILDVSVNASIEQDLGKNRRQLRAAHAALLPRARRLRLSGARLASSTARSATPGRRPTRAAAGSPRRWRSAASASATPSR